MYALELRSRLSKPINSVIANVSDNEARLLHTFYLHISVEQLVHI